MFEPRLRFPLCVYCVSRHDYTTDFLKSQLEHHNDVLRSGGTRVCRGATILRAFTDHKTGRFPPAEPNVSRTSWRSTGLRNTDHGSTSRRSNWLFCRANAWTGARRELKLELERLQTDLGELEEREELHGEAQRNRRMIRG
jgi:hypothetical protein